MNKTCSKIKTLFLTLLMVFTSTNFSLGKENVVKAEEVTAIREISISASEDSFRLKETDSTSLISHIISNENINYEFHEKGIKVNTKETYSFADGAFVYNDTNLYDIKYIKFTFKNNKVSTAMAFSINFSNSIKSGYDNTNSIGVLANIHTNGGYYPKVDSNKLYDLTYDCSNENYGYFQISVSNAEMKLFNNITVGFDAYIITSGDENVLVPVNANPRDYLDDPEKAGCVFKGWSEVENSSELVTQVNKDMTLYPIFESTGATTYDVTFVDELKVVKNNVVTVEENDLLPEPTGMSKYGYTFDGWFKDSEYNTKWDFENDVVSKNETLYAKWTKLATKVYDHRFVSGEIKENGEHTIDGLILNSNLNGTEGYNPYGDCTTDGQRLGTSNSDTTSIVISTKDIIGKIYSISVETKSNTEKATTLNVLVGNENYSSNNTSLVNVSSETTTKYVFINPHGSDSVKTTNFISINYSNSKENVIVYLKSITIEYTPTNYGEYVQDGEFSTKARVNFDYDNSPVISKIENLEIIENDTTINLTENGEEINITEFLNIPLNTKSLLIDLKYYFSGKYITDDNYSKLKIYVNNRLFEDKALCIRNGANGGQVNNLEDSITIEVDNGYISKIKLEMDKNTGNLNITSCKLTFDNEDTQYSIKKVTKNSKEVDNASIEFGTVLDSQMYNLLKDDYTFGMAYAIKSQLNGSTIKDSYDQNFVIKKDSTPVSVNEDGTRPDDYDGESDLGYYQFGVNIYIPSAYFAEKIVAAAYIKDANGNYYFMDEKEAKFNSLCGEYANMIKDGSLQGFDEHLGAFEYFSTYVGSKGEN